MTLQEENLPLSTSDPLANKAAAHFSYQILSSGTEVERILNAVEQFPESVLLQSFAAALFLTMQTKEAQKRAKSHLSKAEHQLKNANIRERLWHQAITSWRHLNHDEAISILKGIARQFPQDMAALKLLEWLHYCCGQVPTAAEMLKLCSELYETNQSNSHFLAMYAFAHELSNNMEKAYQYASKAIDIDVNTPWAHHALGHYYLRTGQLDRGCKELEHFKPRWKNILPLLRRHNSWHLALHYVANRDYNNSISLLENDIWDDQGSYGMIPVHIDAISLLWRMDLAGLNQYAQNKWRDIANHINHYANNHFVPFNNLHHIYATVKAGDVQVAIESLKIVKNYAEKHTKGTDKRWLSVAIPAMEGIIAFALNDYQRAANSINSVLPNIYKVGGSDAQDELFIQTALLANLRSGNLKEAESIFNQYLNHYEKSRLAEFWKTQSSSVK